MSLKQEIEAWVDALKHHDEGNYEKALEIFEQNADTSKIFFNIGMIHATMGEHEKAVEAYIKATKLDSFLAVAYFQMGVSNFLLGEFVEAMANFNEALLYMRGNTFIDYKQLGLEFKLYSCEVLFNRGLCYIYNQELEPGMNDLQYAAKEKQVEDHNVIDEAIKEEAEGYTVFSVGVGVLYRPNEAKVRNVKAKDYLGKARLVAASDAQNAFTGFAGVEVKKTELAAGGAADERDPSEKSFAASNLVKPELQSRRKSQMDAPPPQKSLRGEQQVFPPTPPPENEFAPSKPTRANTVASGMPPRRADPQRPERSGGVREAPEGYGQPSRRPTVLGVPEPRRAYSTRGPPSTASRSRSVRDAPRRPPASRVSEYSDELDGNPYSDDLYDMYGDRRPDASRRGPGSIRRGPSRRAPPSSAYPDDDQYASDAYEGSEFDEEGEFEMVDPRPARRAPEVKKIKVKAHGEDTRMIMISTSIEFDEFISRLKEKFGTRKNIRCKIKDEDGDGMISLSDQEDLDMAISSAKKQARKDRAEHGKLEIWIKEV